MARASWLLLPLLASGCSPGVYLADRGRDFADCFQANAGVGLGLAANVKATDLATVYVGGANNRKFGIVGRKIGTWREMEYGFPVRAIWVTHSLVEHVAGPAGWVCVPHVLWLLGEREVDPGGIDPDELSEAVYLISMPGERKSLRRKIDWFNLELGATAGVVNARVGFSPGQLFDFLFGLAGLDLAGDDTPRAKEEEEPVPASGEGQ